MNVALRTWVLKGANAPGVMGRERVSQRGRELIGLLLQWIGYPNFQLSRWFIWRMGHLIINPSLEHRVEQM